MISLSKAEHLNSFWNRGPGELGNGLLKLFDSVPTSRRATSVEQVYIVSGYPQESTFSPGDLLVAVFVSTGGSKFVSKDILFAVVEEFRGNLSATLGKEITGWGRLHPDFFQATDSSGSSGKSNILYYFFGAMGGALLILAVCVFVTCW